MTSALDAAALREALKPFADLADFYTYCEQHPNGCPDSAQAGELVDLTVGDFRRAARVLAALANTQTDLGDLVSREAAAKVAMKEAANFLQSPSARICAEKIAAAIRAMPISAAREGWQPIETAPKDGSLVLTWQADPAFPVHTIQRYDANQGLWVDREGAWFVVGPSHWRPLPEPPISAAPLSEGEGM